MLRPSNLTIKGIFNALFRREQPSKRIETGKTLSVQREAEMQSFSTAAQIANPHFVRANGLNYAPVRDPNRALRLAKLTQIPEISTISNTIASDCLSSSDGDDIGVSIPDELETGELIDPRIIEIGNACIKRCLNVDVLIPVIIEFLEYGDCFRSLVLNPTISKILWVKDLPTWEMFRIEDEDSRLTEFQQRKHLSDQQGLIIHPAICVHWRYRRRGYYGRSLWEEAADTVVNMDNAYGSLNKAAIATGANPNKHQMPEGWNAEQTAVYKKNHEAKIRQGDVITDYYLYGGADINKVMAGSPDLGALMGTVEHFRRRLAMVGRIPGYLLGLDTPAASKDLSGAPQLAYARFIGGVRQVLAAGIKQVIDMELVLNGYIEPDSRKYRLIFPKFYTEVLQQSTEGEGEESQGSPAPNQPTDEVDEAIAQFKNILAVSNGRH